MTNLAYLWVVHHGETFSFTSIACNFYLVPSSMRKPLSDLPSHQLSEEEKKEWFLHHQSIKDYLSLQKVVTYKEDEFSILSGWNDLDIDDAVWAKVLTKSTKKSTLVREDSLIQTNTSARRKLNQESYIDFWNDLTMDFAIMNTNRSRDGLYNLHWLMVHEMPISLYI